MTGRGTGSDGARDRQRRGEGPAGARREKAGEGPAGARREKAGEGPGKGPKEKGRGTGSDGARDRQGGGAGREKAGEGPRETGQRTGTRGGGVEGKETQPSTLKRTLWLQVSIYIGSIAITFLNSEQFLSP